MRDGRTVESPRRGAALATDLESFLERCEVALVVERGAIAGEEHPVDRPKLVLGRGPAVDIAFQDPEMSSQHALIEWSGAGFRVRDLGSTNGLRVNGSPVEAWDLEPGDRVELGRHVLRWREERHARAASVYCLPED